MKNIHTLAVIGGTGKSGKFLVNQLLHQGISIKLLLRNPENLQVSNPLIEVVQGDARDYESMLKLLRNCQAIISTLGQPKGEPSIFSQATRNIIRAMNEVNIHRYIVTTGLSVDTPLDQKSSKTRYATDWMKTNFPETTLDKQLEYRFLSQSTIDWTLVRLPLIEQSEKRSEIKMSLEDCPGDGVSAANLAHFLIQQLEDNSLIKAAPFIANAS
jgi:putative NADH-flavin reductase